MKSTDIEGFYTESLTPYQEKIKEDINKDRIRKNIQQESANEEDWVKQANAILKNNGSRKRVMDWKTIYSAIFFSVLLTCAVFLCYMAYDEKFKSNVSVNQSVSLEPQINITSNTENNYEENFQNYNNHTIIINNYIYQNGTG